MYSFQCAITKVRIQIKEKWDESYARIHSFCLQHSGAHYEVDSGNHLVRLFVPVSSSPLLMKKSIPLMIIDATEMVNHVLVLASTLDFSGRRIPLAYACFPCENEEYVLFSQIYRC